jgi:hypothetical protein
MQAICMSQHRKTTTDQPAAIFGGSTGKKGKKYNELVYPIKKMAKMGVYCCRMQSCGTVLTGAIGYSSALPRILRNEKKYNSLSTNSIV